MISSVSLTSGEYIVSHPGKSASFCHLVRRGDIVRHRYTDRDIDR
jgi:hypothetical protein